MANVVVTDTAIGEYIEALLGEEMRGEWHDVDLCGTHPTEGGWQECERANDWLAENNINLKMLNWLDYDDDVNDTRWELSSEDAQKLVDKNIALDATA